MKSRERRERLARGMKRTKRTFRNTAYLVGMGIAVFAGVALVLVLLATLINGFARWNAQRIAERENSPEALAERAKDNLLLIAETDGTASGFLAIRWDSEQEAVYGIAIPDAAFLQVPGHGFERIGESYRSGPEVSVAAISNFFGVPFDNYAVVDTEIYQTALTTQSLSGVMEQVDETNMDESEKTRWAKVFDSTPSDNVALVPMPVKPISVGSQTYFEPLRDEVADLVEQWWGVNMARDDGAVTVIVYNGSGVPGIAGVAAQEMIRSGLRVVDTKNADRFDYTTTQIVVQNADETSGEAVREVLGTGEIVMQPADQEIADVIVIIGKDYTGPSESP